MSSQPGKDLRKLIRSYNRLEPVVVAAEPQAQDAQNVQKTLWRLLKSNSSAKAVENSIKKKNKGARKEEEKLRCLVLKTECAASEYLQHLPRFHNPYEVFVVGNMLAFSDTALTKKSTDGNMFALYNVCREIELIVDSPDFVSVFTRERSEMHKQVNSQYIIERFKSYGDSQLLNFAELLQEVLLVTDRQEEKEQPAVMTQQISRQQILLEVQQILSAAGERPCLVYQIYGYTRGWQYEATHITKSAIRLFGWDVSEYKEQSKYGYQEFVSHNNYIEKMIDQLNMILSVRERQNASNSALDEDKPLQYCMKTSATVDFINNLGEIVLKKVLLTFKILSSEILLFALEVIDFK